VFFYWRIELAESQRNSTLAWRDRLFGTRPSKPTVTNRPLEPVIDWFRSVLRLWFPESRWYYRVNIAWAIIVLVMMGIVLVISGVMSKDHGF
jgi:hypothetical protein